MQRRTALLLPLLLCAAAGRSFPVFDNMFFRGKPPTDADGLTLSNIVYQDTIWPHDRGYGTLPPRPAFEAVVRANDLNPGPRVLIIDRMRSKGTAKRYAAGWMSWRRWPTGRARRRLRTWSVI